MSIVETRLKRSRQLMQQSMQFVFKHKSLLMISFLSSLTVLLLLAFLLSPLIRYEKEIITQHPKTETIIWLYLSILLFLFFVHQIAFYFNAALTHCISDYFREKTFSLKNGIERANTRFFKLLLWNIYRSFIGFIVIIFYPMVKNKKFYQKMFFGLRWSIICQLTLPVIVENNTSPHYSAKRSAELIRKNWGSDLKINFGFVPFMLIARILAILPILISLLVGGYKNIIIGVSISFLIILIISTIISSTQTILACVLYHYAAKGILLPEFDEKLIQKAFIKQE